MYGGDAKRVAVPISYRDQGDIDMNSVSGLLICHLILPFEIVLDVPGLGHVLISQPVYYMRCS